MTNKMYVRLLKLTCAVKTAKDVADVRAALKTCRRDDPDVASIASRLAERERAIRKR